MSPHPQTIERGIGNSLIPNGFNLDWVFTTAFVVHTVDTDSNPAGFSNMKQTYSLSSNAYIYTERAVADWEFNGSGKLESTQAGDPGIWQSVTATGVNTGFTSMRIVEAPPPGNLTPTLNQQVVARAMTAPKGQRQYFNDKMNAQ